MQDGNDDIFDSLAGNGITIGSVKLETFPTTGRGIAATKEIRKNETLLTIPTRHLINLKLISKEFDFDWHRSPLPAHVAISLYILLHRSIVNSPLKQYIHSLPRDFETVPLTWRQSLVDRLPLSTQAYLAKQRVVFGKHFTLGSDFVKTRPLLSQALTQNLDRDDFQWAWLAVNSRCIYQELSPTSTRDDNYVCSPLVDMINHVPSNIPHCKLTYDIKGLNVVSQSTYRAGEETFISYGAHSNEALLCEYGFTVACNEDTNISIDTAILNRLEPWHEGFLMELGYYEDYTIDSQGHPSFRADVAIRVSLLSQEECAEGSQGCRRLTQYVNGRITGDSDRHRADAVFLNLITTELQLAERTIKTVAADTRAPIHCQAPDDQQKWELIRVVWQDRIDVLCLAKDCLQ